MRAAEHYPGSILQARGGNAIPRLALWAIDRFVAVTITLAVELPGRSPYVWALAGNKTYVEQSSDGPAREREMKAEGETKRARVRPPPPPPPPPDLKRIFTEYSLRKLARIFQN